MPWPVSAMRSRAGAIDAHVTVRITHVIDEKKSDIAAHAARGPAALSVDHHGVDGRKRRRYARRIVRQSRGRGFRLLMRFDERLQLRLRHRKIDARENDEAGEREEEVKGQRDHAGEIVQIEVHALALLLRAEGEQLAENLAVDDDAAHERREHRERREADDPVTELQPFQVQAVVQWIEELAADLEIAGWQLRAGARVDRLVPVNVVVRVARVGQIEADVHVEHRIAMRGVGAPVHHGIFFGQRAVDHRSREFDGVRIGFGDALEHRPQEIVERRHGLRCETRAGCAQRSISRSNTDNAPKKNTTMSTKPSTRPNQVCSHVMDCRNVWYMFVTRSREAARPPVIAAPPPSNTTHTTMSRRAANAQRNTTR